jgi:hypothetical protein
MTSTFSSRRLRRFLPQSGTQLAKSQAELEVQLKEAMADNEDSDGHGDEDVLDVGDGIDGGDMGSSIGDDDEEPEPMEGEDDEEDEEGIEEDDPIVGNGFVEEVVVELEGSRTRRGRRYDGGGHL